MAAPTKTSMYRFKDITTLPGAKELVDIVLSQTQRRTPTVVHPQFKISRIRSFYMRKVKFCQQTLHDKFTEILTQFPRLDDIHPFYADLCNVLYDRDHYKIALGQVNTVRGIVDHIAKDYVRLLKYADSPYKCKMLKRAALGRMCTTVRKLNDSFKYLEEVRQHLSRLPSINPNTRTFILTGYPNVGKSSFINSLTHANVEVQPYAFTTKSLFVGHFDYAYSRWQVIDTPGILDHPLANRNTIELTAITALAHIQAAVLFFVDISESCGFSIDSQVSLFHSIKILFKNKPLVIVLNKADITKFSELPQDKQSLLQSMTEGLEDVAVLEASVITSQGVDDAKNKACEMLLTKRVEAKIASKRAEVISNRLHVTNVVRPMERPPLIPHSVVMQRRPGIVNNMEDSSLVLAKDLQEANGGAGVYSVDLCADWNLKKDEWKYDIMPEFYAGKNVLDFIDADIDAKLRELEREEAQLLQEDASMEIHDAEWQGVSKVLTELHKKIELRRLENRLKTNNAKKVQVRRSGQNAIADAEDTLTAVGYEIDEGIHPGVQKRSKHVTKMTTFDESEGSGSDDESLAAADSDEAMEHQTEKVKRKKTSLVPQRSMKRKLLTMSRSRTQTVGTSAYTDAIKRAKASRPNRIKSALPTEGLRLASERLKRNRDKIMRKTRKAGEADRFIGTKMPKHLFSGKRSNGKTDRR